MLHAGEFAFAGALVAADLLGQAAVQVGAEGGDFDDLMLAAAAVDDVHDAKAPADDEGAAEQRLHLFGRGVGGNVEVLGAQADQQVAHRTADDIGLITGILERVHHIHGAVVDQLDVDTVFFDGYILALPERGFFGPLGAGLGAVRFAEQLVDEFFDHG